MSDDERRGGRPERARPERGVRYVLDRRRSEEEGCYHYRGRIEGERAGWPLEVHVWTGAETPDGLRVEAAVEQAPPARAATHEKLVAAMVRAAVRRALKEGLSPPRRIQRWRER